MTAQKASQSLKSTPPLNDMFFPTKNCVSCISATKYSSQAILYFTQTGGYSVYQIMNVPVPF